jgi:hypothetical protein
VTRDAASPGRGRPPTNLHGILPPLQRLNNEVIQVRKEDVIETTRRLAGEERIHAGISSGSATWAALRIAERPERGKLIVAVLPDSGGRYSPIPCMLTCPRRWFRRRSPIWVPSSP